MPNVLGHVPQVPAQPAPPTLNGQPPSGFCNAWSRLPPMPTALITVGSSACRAVTVTTDNALPTRPLASLNLKVTDVGPGGNKLEAVTSTGDPLTMRWGANRTGAGSATSATVPPRR